MTEATKALPSPFPVHSANGGFQENPEAGAGYSIAAVLISRKVQIDLPEPFRCQMAIEWIARFELRGDASGKSSKG